MEAEFNKIDKEEAWGRLYQQIRTECNNYDYSCTEAKKPENKNLNRYRDVSPYDHSRVKLNSGSSDYINASLVQVPVARRNYILAQGPLPHTTGHFWQMVWEQNSKAVLMLNKTIEKNQIKCHQYWPLGSNHDGDDVMVLEDVGLQIEYLSEVNKIYYVIRQLKITHLKTSASRVVQHFHYTTWPDFGVPESPAAFLTFLLAVRNAGALDENVGPPIVHCSAGIGRSGTFCLVDTCLVLIEQRESLDSIDIEQILLNMRTYRMGLIQTPDQLRFSYLAVIEGGRRILAGTFHENTMMNADNNHKILNNSNDDESPPPLPPRTRDADGHASGLAAGADLDVPNDYYMNQNTHNSVDTPINDTELRKRARHDRIKKTAQKIEQMKRRQQDCETWRKRRSYLMPLSIGLLIILGGGVLAYKLLKG